MNALRVHCYSEVVECTGCLYGRTSVDRIAMNDEIFVINFYLWRSVVAHSSKLFKNNNLKIKKYLEFAILMTWDDLH